MDNTKENITENVNVEQETPIVDLDVNEAIETPTDVTDVEEEEAAATAEEEAGEENEQTTFNTDSIDSLVEEGDVENVYDEKE